MKTVVLKIRNIETGEIVKTLDPMPELKAERVLKGMLINMNTDKFCVDEEEETR